jgi:hypothetical protein
MKGGSTALLHFVATCRLTCAASAGTAEAVTGLESPLVTAGRRDLQASRTAGVTTADLVRPSRGPRARCGKGFVLKYASRRRRGWSRGAPRRQGTGQYAGTRQDGEKSGIDRREAATRTEKARRTDSSTSTASPSSPYARSRARRSAAPRPWRNTTSCQRWKRTGTSPSHPSASPLNHVVLIKELQLGRRPLHSYRLKILLVLSPGTIGGCPGTVGRVTGSADISQVADCGRLRGASIHRAK